MKACTLFLILSFGAVAMESIGLKRQIELKEIENNGYKYSVALGFTSGSSEVDIYRDPKTMTTDGCTLILSSVNASVEPQDFSITEIRSDSPNILSLGRIGSWSKTLLSSNESEETLLDVKCYKPAFTFHIWNPFGKNRIEKTLKGYVEIN